MAYILGVPKETVKSVEFDSVVFSFSVFRHVAFDTYWFVSSLKAKTCEIGRAHV